MPFPFLRAGVRRVSVEAVLAVSRAAGRQSGAGLPLTVPLQRRKDGLTAAPVPVTVTVSDPAGSVW